MNDKKVIIVGAGIGGLSAGYWLRQKGYEVEILEASDQPGGRMMTLERKGDRVDVGAQFYHSNYRYAFELMDAMNLSGTKRPVTANAMFALDDGSTFLFDTESRVPYIKVLGLRGNLKLYWFILRYVIFGHRFSLYKIAEDIPEYDNVEGLDLFKGPSGQALRDFFVEPMIMASPEGFSLSLYHFVRSIRFNLMSDPIALSGGVASLADELARCLSVQYEAPVRQLVMEKGRIVGVQMKKDGSIKKADHVVVATDPPSTARLLPEELEEQRRFFESFVALALPMPIFFLDRPLRKDVWAYLNKPSLRNTVMFALDETAKIPEMVPSGKSIVTGWLAHPEALEDLLDAPDDEIIKEAQDGIEPMISGFSKWVEDATVVRHPFVVPAYDLGAHRRVLDFLDQTKELKGVSFVGDVFGGGYMEAAIESAVDAVNRICEGKDTA